MIKLLIKYVVFFFLGFLVFLGHKYFTVQYRHEDQIDFLVFNYLFNSIATLCILGILHLINKIDRDFLGFLLMLMGVVKILIYGFLIKTIGYSLERHLFLLVFLPYGIGQSIEILGLISLMKLNNINTIKEL